MLHHAIVALTLAGVPAPSGASGLPPESFAPAAPSDFSDRLDSTDVAVSEADAMVAAYDRDGAVIGSFGLWVDEHGTTWIAADFPDGYALLGVSPTQEVIYREETLPPDVLADRAELLLGTLDPAETAARHSWGECAWKTVAAGGACWASRPIACGFGAIKAGCACVPKLIKEFDEYECPWGL